MGKHSATPRTTCLRAAVLCSFAATIARFAVLALVIVLIEQTALIQNAAADELLELALAAHRVSRASIHTCSCRVELTASIAKELKEAPGTQSCSCRYWYSQDAIRAKISEGGAEMDYLFSNFVRKGVIRRNVNGQPAMTGTRDGFTGAHRSRCDAWVRALLLLNIPSSTEFVTLEELVKRATKISKTSREFVNGKEVIGVELAFDRVSAKGRSATWDVYVRLDPGKNYLVQRVEYSTTWYRRHEEVTQFAEAAPGLFFPERIVGSSDSNGKFHGNSVSVISDLRINQKLPADTFAFRYPNGIPVADSIRGTEYRVNPEGQPISKETPLGRDQPPPRNESAPVGGVDTQEEPRSLLRLLVPVSLGALALAALLAFYRFRRDRISVGHNTRE